MIMGNNELCSLYCRWTVMSVPMDADNRHYAEILKQVADGTLTIADAD